MKSNEKYQQQYHWMTPAKPYVTDRSSIPPNTTLPPSASGCAQIPPQHLADLRKYNYPQHYQSLFPVTSYHGAYLPSSNHLLDKTPPMGFHLTSTAQTSGLSLLDSEPVQSRGSSAPFRQSFPYPDVLQMQHRNANVLPQLQSNFTNVHDSHSSLRLLQHQPSLPNHPTSALITGAEELMAFATSSSKVKAKPEKFTAPKSSVSSSPKFTSREQSAFSMDSLVNSNGSANRNHARSESESRKQAYSSLHRSDQSPISSLSRSVSQISSPFPTDFYHDAPGAHPEVNLSDISPLKLHPNPSPLQANFYPPYTGDMLPGMFYPPQLGIGSGISACHSAATSTRNSPLVKPAKPSNDSFPKHSSSFNSQQQWRKIDSPFACALENGNEVDCAKSAEKEPSGWQDMHNVLLKNHKIEDKVVPPPSLPGQRQESSPVAAPRSYHDNSHAFPPKPGNNSGSYPSPPGYPNVQTLDHFRETIKAAKVQPLLASEVNQPIRTGGATCCKDARYLASPPDSNEKSQSRDHAAANLSAMFNNNVANHRSIMALDKLANVCASANPYDMASVVADRAADKIDLRCNESIQSLLDEAESDGRRKAALNDSAKRRKVTTEPNFSTDEVARMHAENPASCAAVKPHLGMMQDAEKRGKRSRHPTTEDERFMYDWEYGEFSSSPENDDARDADFAGPQQQQQQPPSRPGRTRTSPRAAKLAPYAIDSDGDVGGWETLCVDHKPARKRLLSPPPDDDEPQLDRRSPPDLPVDVDRVVVAPAAEQSARAKTKKQRSVDARSDAAVGGDDGAATPEVKKPSKKRKKPQQQPTLTSPGADGSAAPPPLPIKKKAAKPRRPSAQKSRKSAQVNSNSGGSATDKLLEFAANDARLSMESAWAAQPPPPPPKHAAMIDGDGPRDAFEPYRTLSERLSSASHVDHQHHAPANVTAPLVSKPLVNKPLVNKPLVTKSEAADECRLSNDVEMPAPAAGSDAGDAKLEGAGVKVEGGADDGAKAERSDAKAQHKKRGRKPKYVLPAFDAAQGFATSGGVQQQPVAGEVAALKTDHPALKLDPAQLNLDLPPANLNLINAKKSNSKPSTPKKQRTPGSAKKKQKLVKQNNGLNSLTTADASSQISQVFAQTFEATTVKPEPITPSNLHRWDVGSSPVADSPIYRFNLPPASPSPVSELPPVAYPPVPPRKLTCNSAVGETLLHKAAQLGYLDNIEYYLERGQDVNARDNAGYSALHEACVHNRLQAAKLLLEYGADVNLNAVDGTRPLHDAVEYDHVEMTRLVLACGADVMLSKFSGRSVREMIRSKGMSRFIHAYLKELEPGVDPCSGDEARRDELRWELAASRVLDPPDDAIGCDPLGGAPEESGDELEFEVFAEAPLESYFVEPTGNLRSANFYILEDVLKREKCSRADFLLRSCADVRTVRAEDFRRKLAFNWVPRSDVDVDRALIEVVACETPLGGARRSLRMSTRRGDARPREVEWTARHKRTKPVRPPVTSSSPDHVTTSAHVTDDQPCCSQRLLPSSAAASCGVVERQRRNVELPIVAAPHCDTSPSTKVERESPGDISPSQNEPAPCPGSAVHSDAGAGCATSCRDQEQSCPELPSTTDDGVCSRDIDGASPVRRHSEPC